MRSLPLRAERLFLVLSALFPLLAIGHSASGGEPTRVLLFSFLLATIALWLSVGVGLTGSRRGHLQRAALVTGIAVPAILASVALTQWPLRLSASIFRGGLEALADRVEAGAPISSPIRVGWLVIRGTELTANGATCLWTDLDSAGRMGFVRSAPGQEPGSIWSELELKDGWRFIAED